MHLMKVGIKLHLEPKKHPNNKYYLSFNYTHIVNKMEVLVFITNVKKPEQVSKIKPLLTAVPAIFNWNIDLDDCDNVLRIEAGDISPRDIEALLRREGYNCRELDY